MSKGPLLVDHCIQYIKVRSKKDYTLQAGGTSAIATEICEKSASRNPAQQKQILNTTPQPMRKVTIKNASIFKTYKELLAPKKSAFKEMADKTAFEYKSEFSILSTNSGRMDWKGMDNIWQPGKKSVSSTKELEPLLPCIRIHREVTPLSKNYQQNNLECVPKIIITKRKQAAHRHHHIKNQTIKLPPNQAPRASDLVMREIAKILKLARRQNFMNAQHGTHSTALFCPTRNSARKTEANSRSAYSNGLQEQRMGEVRKYKWRRKGERSASVKEEEELNFVFKIEPTANDTKSEVQVEENRKEVKDVNKGRRVVVLQKLKALSQKVNPE